MPDDLRMQGYRDALAEHGILFDARLVTGTSFGKESGRAGVRSLLDSGPTTLVPRDSVATLRAP